MQFLKKETGTSSLELLAFRHLELRGSLNRDSLRLTAITSVQIALQRTREREKNRKVIIKTLSN